MATIDEPLGSMRVRRTGVSLSEHIYNWIATVDHKRLGLMYIIFALVFFVDAGNNAQQRGFTGAI